MASALTFDALLAAIPFILLLLVGLTQVVHYLAGGPEVDPHLVLHRFLPPHAGGSSDPFTQVERLFAGIAANRGQLSLIAVPTFIWFSTRLFAGVRTALNDVYDVAVRPSPNRGIVVGFLLGKLRDAVMVIATLVLFLANTVLTTGLTVLQARGAAAVPELEFFVGAAGRVLGELATLLFSVSLFFLVYKYASVRRLPWKTALLASVFAAIAFEIAKRLYAFYLANFATAGGPGVGDATIGALVLFVLWVYYTAIVFLLGGVVAETWELRRMQRRQRAVIG